jgi:hypothetical protein
MIAPATGAHVPTILRNAAPAMLDPFVMEALVTLPGSPRASPGELADRPRHKVVRRMLTEAADSKARRR